MTVTFTPATNRYAAIVAHVAATPAPSPRNLFALTFVERAALDAGDPPPPRPGIGRPQTGDTERAARKAAVLADYAAAFPATTTKAEHAMLCQRLAAHHGVSPVFVKTVTADWREKHNVHVPTYVADGDALRPGEVELLRALAAEPGVISAHRLTVILGRGNVMAVGYIVSATRLRLVALTNDPDAYGVIATVARPRGYQLDRALAARYPVVVAAIGDTL